MVTSPDVAFPLGRMRPRLDPLRWVLRSIDYHLPIGRVFLACARLPSWVDPDDVVWIPTSQEGTKHENIGENLRAVLESDISEDFLWFNDDIFVLRDLDHVELHHRDIDYDDWYQEHRLKARGGSDHWNYIGGMLGQYELLGELGWPRSITTDAHVPMPLNKTRLKEILALIPPTLEGHFRAVYGACLESTPVVDPKIKTADALPELFWDYVSVDNGSWLDGAVGEYLRNRYWRPSRFEIVS